MKSWPPAMLLMTACSLSMPPRQAPAPPGPDIALNGVTLRNYRGHSLHLTATMPHLELMRGTTDLAATQVTTRLATGAVITAQAVSGNANEGRIVGSNGVTLSSPDGVEGRAPTATYEKSLGAQGSAHADAGVHLEHPRFSLDAQAFEVDFASERAHFTHADTHTKATAR